VDQAVAALLHQLDRGRHHHGLLDDAVDEHLIASNPLRQRPKRGRRREQQPVPVERIWAAPEQIVWIADQTFLLGSYIDWLLIVTTGWTGVRWGGMTGLHRRNTHLDDLCVVIDPDVGCLHEGAHGLWLGPPKTPASARTRCCESTWSPMITSSCSPHSVAAGYAEAISSAGCSAQPSTATWT
jgi:hypothetical protein